MRQGDRLVELAVPGQDVDEIHQRRDEAGVLVAHSARPFLQVPPRQRQRLGIAGSPIQDECRDQVVQCVRYRKLIDSG
jgi:hypothetical protein